MKKILVMEDSRKVGFGGGQKGSLEVLEALADDFEVLATDSVTDSIFATKAQQILGKPVHRIRAFGAISGGESASFSVGLAELALFPFFTIWNWISLAGLLRRQQMNSQNAVLYAPLKKTLVLAWLLSLTTRIPFVYHARNIDDRNHPLFRILAVMLKRATTILCVSRAVADNLDMPQCQILYNAVPNQKNATPRLNPLGNSASGNGQAARNRLVVAAMASLLPWKGLKYLVQAAGLSRHRDNVDIRIYGKGPQEDELRTLCGPNCRLMGFADNVNELMASEIDVVCTPSVSEEAFGRVPMEGNSFGIPAIVTNIGAQAEITMDGKTGYHVPPRCAQSIADAIDHMIDNPQHYQLLSRQALEHSKNFDLGAHRARLLEIFRGIYSR